MQWVDHEWSASVDHYLFFPGSAAAAPSEDVPFQLWGLTMAATSDVLDLAGAFRNSVWPHIRFAVVRTLALFAGLPRLNWPPIRFRGRFANTVVAAICGAVELWQVVNGTRSVRFVSPTHVAALLALPLGTVGMTLAVKWVTVNATLLKATPRL